MGDTSRWSLTYPEKTDRPEGWLQLKTLADDVEAALGKAYSVADTAARTALGTALGVAGRGFIALQVDTGQPYMWLGGSWLALGGAGGGGGVSSRGRWRQTGTAQSIPDSADTVVRFDADTLTTADIVKSTSGAGHAFTFQRAGVLRGSVTVRYATTTAAGVRDCHVVLGNNADYLASSGGAIAGQPRTHSMSIGPVDVADDAVLSVRCFQGTGAPRNLEPNAGAWVHMELELT